jgi:hypothetical protein
LIICHIESGLSTIVIARTYIFKIIKKNKLIKSRIQKYGLHFDYFLFFIL